MALLGYTTPTRSGAFLSPTYKKAPRMEGETDDAYQFRAGKQNQTEFKNVIAPITPTGTMGGTTAGKSPMGDTPPKFDVLMNVKDPLIDTAAVNALKGAQQTGEQAQSLFSKYLTEMTGRENTAKNRLDTELKTYDTAATDLEKSLAANLKQQEAGLAKAREVNLQALRGADERYSLGMGPLGTGRSGEQERTFADSYYRAVLPYEQQVAALGRENIGAVNAARLQTAPLARSAEQQYLASLLTPAQAASALRSDELRNLGAASSLLASNRFYTPYSDDPRLIPNLGVPQASYRLPQTPNYGGYPSPQARYSYNQSGDGYNPPRGTDGSIGQRGPRVSAAEQAYFDRTGRWPVRDPQFNPELYEMLGGRVAWGNAGSPSPAPTGTSSSMAGGTGEQGSFMLPPSAGEQYGPYPEGWNRAQADAATMQEYQKYAPYMEQPQAPQAAGVGPFSGFRNYY